MSRSFASGAISTPALSLPADELGGLGKEEEEDGACLTSTACTDPANRWPEGLEVVISTVPPQARPLLQNYLLFGFYAAWGTQGLNNKIITVILLA